jgi:hypothetical protein
MVFKKGDKRPEGAGRTKGIANKLTEEYKDLIAKSSPIEFLIEAFTKGRVGGDILTYKERCDIARDLAKKIVPDLKSIDHGKIEGTVTILMNSSITHAPNEKVVATDRQLIVHESGTDDT